MIPYPSRPRALFALAAGLALATPAAATEPYLGEIALTATLRAPAGWAFCHGQTLPIRGNDALYSLLGTRYGGDGVTTFALPDLRGRAAIGAGRGPGLPTVKTGEKVGAHGVTLTPFQVPGHAHTGVADHGPHLAVTGGVGSESPAGAGFTPDGTDRFATGGTPTALRDSLMAAQTDTTIGAEGDPVPNDPPYLTLNYVIALEGVYPSRN